MQKNLKILCFTFILSISCTGVYAQNSSQIESAGRGWSVDMKNQAEPVGASVPFWNLDVSSAKGGESPVGTTPLSRDIFTSDDFYIDRELWTDERYFRCNSPLSLDSQWGDYATGPKVITGLDPATGAWGYCNRDIPREALVSPYPFKSAQEQYEALLAETKTKGGPTTLTPAEMASWYGRYTRSVNIIHTATQEVESAATTPEGHHESPPWELMHLNQMPTILSLLTEEYQTRLVQQLYHQAHGRAAQWSLMYCRPEGFMRHWSGPGFSGIQMLPTPELVLLNGQRTVFLTREFNMDGPVPRLGEDVRQWYGETIGFWDDNALITWTSNIQGWMTHASWDHSSYLQTIEIFTQRHTDAGEFVGIEHEAIFYDPEAFVEPVRVVRFLPYAAGLSDNGPPLTGYQHCNQTIYPIEGRGQHVQPGTVIQYTIPDTYNRPWAKIWEDYFEQDMQRPEVDLFNFQ